MHVDVRFYAELVELAGGADAAVPVGTPRSVKDLIESQGVPHVEVGLILVNDEPSGFDRRVAAGDRVAVYPPFRHIPLDGVTTVTPPPPEPRFVLDVHLGTLARRLRVLGFDVWYRAHADDEELARVAVEQQRILLSRDRGLLMRRTVVHGYCPRSDDPDLQVHEVVRRYHLLQHLAPFTRCPACNAPLEEVTRDEVYDDLPPRTREEHDRFTRCPGCARLYWPGSHRAALEEVLDGVRSRGS